MSKKRISSRAKHDGTPGSGEALLRGQVKTLLQKVEEEAELSKLSLETRSFVNHRGFDNSPLTLIAPTPANTPQILDFSADGSSQSNGFRSFTQSPVDDNFPISQINKIFEGKKQEGNESELNLMITRSLLLDFSEKSEGFCSSDCSSEVTYQGGESEGKDRAIVDDDDSSIWSIQVNTSNRDDQEGDEEEGLEVEEDCDNDYLYEEEEEKEDDGLVDELCHAISKISVNGEKTMAKFTGKHTRFVYNSDDELDGEEEDSVVNSEPTASLSALNLRGLPTPKGKHLRFPDDE